MQQASPNSSLSVSPNAGDNKHVPSRLLRSRGLALPVDRARGPRKMDPLVDIEYRGFALRCSAHRQGAKAFLPALEIRADDGDGELVYERLFRDAFEDEQQAVEEARKCGLAVVDGFCQSELAIN